MVLRGRILGIIFGVLVSGVFQAQADPAHIIILRHAEKVSDDERTLSSEGYARAEALAQYFSDPAFLKVYGVPAIFYAASPEGDRSLRSVETVTPAAKALKVPLDSSFDKDDGRQLMQYILRTSKFDGKTVVICWNRKGIPELLEPLVGDFPNRWSDKVFDRFWILNLQSDGNYSFKSMPQDLSFAL